MNTDERFFFSQLRHRAIREEHKSIETRPLFANRSTRTVTAKRRIAAWNLFGRRRKNARSTLQLNQSPLLPSFPPAIPSSRFFRLKFTPATIPLEKKIPRIPLHFSIDRVISCNEINAPIRRAITVFNV